jgi:hypothetical protein
MPIEGTRAFPLVLFLEERGGGGGGGGGRSKEGVNRLTQPCHKTNA